METCATCANEPASATPAPKYSVVVPFYNEDQIVQKLYDRIVRVMRHVGKSYEMIFINDGSRDNTGKVLESIALADERVTFVDLRRNFGQTTALQAGFDHARGEVIIAMDGDLQHDPYEIPLFIKKIDEGYDIVALVPSCALMLKSEWKLIVPKTSPDYPLIEKLAASSFDVSEYMVDIARKEGLAPGLAPIEGGVTLHIACHARAQNIGQKGAEMLRRIPGLDLKVIERCSGHGGSWALHKHNFEVAMKVGAPVAQQAAKAGKGLLASECPLAGQHVLQGLERIEGATVPPESLHPIQILARAYGLA